MLKMLVVGLFAFLGKLNIFAYVAFKNMEKPSERPSSIFLHS